MAYKLYIIKILNTETNKIRNVHAYSLNKQKAIQKVIRCAKLQNHEIVIDATAAGPLLTAN